MLWVILAAIVGLILFKIFEFFKSKANSIPDTYSTIEEVQDALRKAGLESSNLIIGIDYTKSNEYSGAKSFGRNMHDILPVVRNPYQQVIEIIGKTLEPFDDDKLIPTYGFGDSTTGDKKVFPFFPNRSCQTVREVLTRYNEITPRLQLAGPTNFAPLINEAVRIVRESKSYHILLIIADGQVTNENETRQAIVEAAKYPLSIVVVGVGDGPWNLMREFDDGLPQRQFDNFQFVDFTDVLRRKPANLEASFALHALMEIPEQYKAIRRLKML